MRTWRPRGPDALRGPVTATFRVAKTFTLPGKWGYGPYRLDGSILYATEYLGTGANPRYQIRSVSLVGGEPFGGSLVDDASRTRR